MKHLVTICAAAFFLTQPFLGAAQISTNYTLVSGGLLREYRVYKPASYTGNTAVPLLLNLHGYTSNNLQQEFYGDFRSIADTANFLIVLPNGTVDAQGQTFWNTFNGPSTVDDLQFIADLLDTLENNYKIDKNRIYSTGMSNGGFMSYALACGLSTRIAAIASVTGSMTPINMAACSPSRPVPVMEIHGTADDVVPYTGLGGFVPIPNLVDKWVAHNHCNSTPVFTAIPNTNTTDGCTAERYLYTGGDNGSTVEHYKIIGGGHTWPGTIFTIGVTNQDINASREIWRFLRQYRLNQLTSSNELVDQSASAQLIPNPSQGAFTIYASAKQKIHQIAVYAITGQLSYEWKSNAPIEQHEIATTHWTPGIYIVRLLKADGSAEVKKVVVE